MTGSCTYLFVYGTLRKNIASPMSALLAREAGYAGQAYLQAELYNVGRYPGAVLSADPAERVRGDVYLPHDAAALFALLDDYEECTHRYEQPHEYVRTIVEIAMLDETRQVAWTYLYNRPTATLARIASGDYLRFLNEFAKY